MTISEVLMKALMLLLLLPSMAFGQTIASKTETKPYPGVTVWTGRTSGPATDFYAAFIDLCTDYVHVDASAYQGYKTSASWASSSGVELAVNGDFYTASPIAHVYGDVVASGTRWAANRTGRDSAYSGDWYYKKYGWIAFGDGWVDFSNTQYVKRNYATIQSDEGFKPQEVTFDIPPGTRALVSGFPQLVIGGNAVTCSSPTATNCFTDRGDMRQRHPRTAMGLTADRKTFILAVVDGRSTRSAGMYGTELAKLMKTLGAHTAFNLDGGGSSQMFVRGQGTINRPSDGTPRTVLNHWGVHAGSASGLPKLPSSCHSLDDAIQHDIPGTETEHSADLNGDGRADVCIRTEQGVQCHLSTGQGFGPVIQGPALSDSSGWGGPDNYPTLRFGDINADGRADLCARANAGMRCWLFDGEGFGEAITGPDWSDARGFNAISAYTTIRMADVNGDGRSDLCARTPEGVECALSTGSGFEPVFAGPPLRDANGWGKAEHFATMRMGDVNGDQKADICARAAAGWRCYLSQGDSFGPAVTGPEWSNAKGWNEVEYWSTIRMADIDADGAADLCGRSSTGMVCHLADGSGGFGPAIEGPNLSDASGWSDASNFATVRLADVTGDGRLDLCARGNNGMRCWPFDGESFGAAWADGPMKDETGWSNTQYYRTITFADLDGDGKADVCARASQNYVCWKSTGSAFESTLISGPAWSDALGFADPKYYSTTRLIGPIRPLPEPEIPITPPDPEVPETPTDPTDPVNNPDGPTDPIDLGSDEGMEENMVAVEVDDGCSTTGGFTGFLSFLGVLFWRRRRAN